jgi:hypothetical protein
LQRVEYAQRLDFSDLFVHFALCSFSNPLYVYTFYFKHNSFHKLVYK